MATPGELSPKQHRAISALLTSPNVKAAAAAAQVGERTLWRWLQDDPSFIEAYRAARERIVGQAVAVIQGLMGEAAGTLRAVMSDTEAPSSARVSAAKTALDMGLRAKEVDELEARILAIEKQIKSEGRI